MGNPEEPGAVREAEDNKVRPGLGGGGLRQAKARSLGYVRIRDVGIAKELRRQES